MQPGNHLLHRYLAWIEDHPVDLAETLPAAFDRQDAGPPLQSGFTDIISANGKGGAGRIFRSLRESRPVRQEEDQRRSYADAERNDLL